MTKTDIFFTRFLLKCYPMQQTAILNTKSNWVTTKWLHFRMKTLAFIPNIPFAGNWKQLAFEQNIWLINFTHLETSCIEKSSLNTPNGGSSINQMQKRRENYSDNLPEGFFLSSLTPLFFSSSVKFIFWTDEWMLLHPNENSALFGEKASLVKSTVLYVRMTFELNEWNSHNSPHD